VLKYTQEYTTLMSKLLIVGDPKGTHALAAINAGWSPLDIVVVEFDRRYVYAIKCIDAKLEVILDDENLSKLNDLVMTRRRFTRAIGNPPYGGLDLKILNMVSELTDDIYFIMPRSIRKAHRVNAMNPHLHIVSDETNPDDMFGREIRTCIQRYEVRDDVRAQIERPQSHNDFEFLKKGDPSVNVFIVRSGNAGDIRTDYETYKDMEHSHYFICAKDQTVIDRLVAMGEELKELGRESSGLGKLSKPEIVTTYIKHYGI